jgi:HAD superfamily hydrolase (TIGR01549 family)
MIHWVFFDVGNVLLNEDPLSYQVFARHVEAIRRIHPERTFTELLAERETKALAGSRWPVYEMAAKYLASDQLDAVWADVDREFRANYTSMTPVLPGAHEVVETLGSSCRLGLIANQPREARARLAAANLIDPFDVIVLSEEVNLFKPDRAIFERALDAANAKPGECLMVGDRVDNDIHPACALGMATAWIRWPAGTAKGWAVPDEDAQAYVESLARVRRALNSAIGPAPDITVDEAKELPQAFAQRQNSADC